MKKKYIIILALLVLLAIGVGAYFFVNINWLVSSPTGSSEQKNTDSLSAVPINVISGTLVGFRFTSLTIEKKNPAGNETYTVNLAPETLHMMRTYDKKTESVKLTSAAPGLRLKKGIRVEIFGEGDVRASDFKPVQVTYFFDE